MEQQGDDLDQQQQQLLAILVECCSAWNLREKIDAYVTVKFCGEKVHGTKAIWKSDHPIWTIEENNVFILNTTEEELRNSGGLVFTIKDYNFARKNKSVGTVFVSGKDILNASPSKRYEYDIWLSEEEDGDLDEEATRRKMMSRASYYLKGKGKKVSVLLASCNQRRLFRSDFV